jgi:hypothetical protein
MISKEIIKNYNIYPIDEMMRYVNIIIGLVIYLCYDGERNYYSYG